MPTFVSTAAGPEQRAADHERGKVIEAAVDALPEVYRMVFVLREVEGLSTAETAASLDINAETVKTRLPACGRCSGTTSPRASAPRLETRSASAARAAIVRSSP